MTAPPLWHQSMRSDRSEAKPPTWGEWKERYGFWDWVLWPEWAAEWIVYWSRSWDFVKVLELSGRFTILIVAVTWLFGADEREKARLDAVKSKHYRAWELINSARGSTGDGGRRDALQDLREDGVDLSAAPLSKALLLRVELPRARLMWADLSGAILIDANLTGATLFGANLTGANLMRANLTGAIVFGADLTGANLAQANLTGANLAQANLTGAELSGANLSGANLFAAAFDTTAQPPSGWELYKDEQGTSRLRRADPPPPAQTSPPP